MVYLTGDEQKGEVHLVGEKVAFLSCVGWEAGFGAWREREGVSENLKAKLA